MPGSQVQAGLAQARLMEGARQLQAPQGHCGGQPPAQPLEAGALPARQRCEHAVQPQVGPQASQFVLHIACQNSGDYSADQPGLGRELEAVQAPHHSAAIQRKSRCSQGRHLPPDNVSLSVAVMSVLRGQPRDSCMHGSWLDFCDKSCETSVPSPARYFATIQPASRAEFSHGSHVRCLTSLMHSRSTVRQKRRCSASEAILPLCASPACTPSQVTHHTDFTCIYFAFSAKLCDGMRQ